MTGCHVEQINNIVNSEKNKKKIKEKSMFYLRLAAYAMRGMHACTLCVYCTYDETRSGSNMTSSSRSTRSV